MGKIVQLFVIAALVAVLQCFPVEESSEDPTKIHTHHQVAYDPEHHHEHDKDHSEENTSEKSLARDTRDVTQHHQAVGSASNPSVGGPGSTYVGSAGRAAPSVGHSQSHPSALSQPAPVYSSNNRQQNHRQVREAESTSASATTEQSSYENHSKDSKEERVAHPQVLTATSESRQVRDTEHTEATSTTEESSLVGQQQVRYSHNRPANIGQDRHVREVSSTTESEQASTTEDSNKAHPSLLSHQRHERDTKQQTAPASHVHKDAKAKPVAKPTLLTQKRH